MNPNADRMTTRFGTVRYAARDRVDSSLRRRMRELRSDAAEALGLPLAAVVPSHSDLEFSEFAASELGRLCVQRAEEISRIDPEAARPLYILALELQHLALDIQQDDLGTRTSRLTDCADGLSRLRAVSGTTDLLLAACQEIVTRGNFGRAVISKVEGDAWAPSVAHFASDDGSWFGEWVGAKIPLSPTTPERQTLVHRRPALVLDTDHADVHRPIIVESGQSSSYVVAPLIVGADVIGLIHVDHFPEDRRVDETDREILGSFASGFTRLLDRMSLMERLQAQRVHVDAIIGSAVDELDSRAVDAAGAFRLGMPVQIQDFGEVTPREAEVLKLMVAGHSNPTIASLLGISLDTVKSHVKQILRKLGVNNRAQAIARAAGIAAAS